MRLLFTILSLLLCISTLSAQDRIDLRLSHSITNEDTRYQPSIQATYHISPRPGYLGVLLGTEFTYIRSEDRFTSCTNCDPVFHDRITIHAAGKEVNSYVASSYSTSMTAALFLRLQWNPRRERKLRIFPSLDLMASTDFLHNYYQDEFWGYTDGTSLNPPKIEVYRGSNQIEVGVFFRSEFKIDYLVLPELKMRIGLVYWGYFDLPGIDYLKDGKQNIGIYLSKAIKG